MRNALRFLSLVAVFAASTAAWPSGQVQQVGGGRAAGPGPIGEGPQQPLVGTGFIAGQVVDVVSGKPIPDVTVTALGRFVTSGRASLMLNPSLTTDSQGRFFFANLRTGNYSFQVYKVGYVVAPAAVGLSVDIAEAERVTDVRIRLAKFASLSGALRDEAGDPVVGTDVYAFRRTVVNGRSAMQAVSKSRSDDRGVYRLSGLPAGDYVVCACSRDPIPFDPTLLTTLASEPLQLMTVAARALTVGSDVVSLDNTLRTYAPAFHQNSSTMARATRIALAPGEDKVGVDMNLQLVHATRVSGTVVGAPGPLLASSMRLFPEADAEAGNPLASLPPMLVQADGRFDFTMVPPGQYRLLIVQADTTGRASGPSGAAMGFVGTRGTSPPPAGGPPAARGAAPAQLPPFWANEPVTVGENGVSGLVITMNPGPQITGRLEWIGAAPQPQAQVFNRIIASVQPVSMIESFGGMGGVGIGRFAPDATFLVPGVTPGKYIVTVTPAPGYPTLKSVVVAGLDVTDLPLEVGQKDLGGVVITYVDAPMASLTVNVPAAVAGSKDADDAMLLIFPADRKYWTEPAAARRRYGNRPLTARASTTPIDLPAGDYLVAIATGLEAQDWMEATKLDALSKRGLRVTVGDTGAARIEVRR